MLPKYFKDITFGHIRAHTPLSGPAPVSEAWPVLVATHRSLALRWTLNRATEDRLAGLSPFVYVVG